MVVLLLWLVDSLFEDISVFVFFFFSSRRRHTRFKCDWSSDVCSSDLTVLVHYRSLKVFSLGGWSPLLPTNSPGFVVLRMPTPTRLARPLLDSHHLRWCLPAPSGAPLGWLLLVLQPQHS